MNAISDIRHGGGQSGDRMVEIIVGEGISKSADAELILVCGQFVEIEHRIRALYQGPDALEDDDAADVATHHLDCQIAPLLVRMEQLRASTVFGIQARAAALAAHNSDFSFSFDDRETVAGSLLDWLMRDAMALAAGGAPVGPVDSTDAASISIQAGSI